MTDQEIYNYCRNVGNIKIRCDDCKFVEDCVDYGWEDCKKFTPKPSEPMTNEEYMYSCSSDELVSILCKLVDSGILQEWRIKYHCADSDEDAVRMWLKQPRKEN